MYDYRRQRLFPYGSARQRNGAAVGFAGPRSRGAFPHAPTGEVKGGTGSIRLRKARREVARSAQRATCVPGIEPRIAPRRMPWAQWVHVRVHDRAPGAGRASRYSAMTVHMHGRRTVDGDIAAVHPSIDQATLAYRPVVGGCRRRRLAVVEGTVST